MVIGYIGLGKMGHNMVERLVEKGYRVVAYDVNLEARASARRAGAIPAANLQDLVAKLGHRRVVWLMVPHDVVDMILHELLKYLKRGDTVIDGGNSFYELTVLRARRAAAKGIHYLDAGVSGGPAGARNGACVMVGGQASDFKKHEKLFRDLSVKNGSLYAGNHGAGHFVKMVHNGIEYGMMQALAEGFAVMKKSPYKLNLGKISALYNHGSVIESRLVGWLERAYAEHGDGLKNISGTVGATGEGEWTVSTAKKLGVPVPIIEEAFKFRVQSKKKPSYTGQVLSALRNQFGGHSVSK